jgi:uncharacterized membrane protein HdeD (DUF308 family)
MKIELREELSNNWWVFVLRLLLMLIYGLLFLSAGS